MYIAIFMNYAYMSATQRPKVLVGKRQRLVCFLFSKRNCVYQSPIHTSTAISHLGQPIHIRDPVAILLRLISPQKGCRLLDLVQPSPLVHNFTLLQAFERGE
jgi:hypothetical protein